MKLDGKKEFPSKGGHRNFREFMEEYRRKERREAIITQSVKVVVAGLLFLWVNEGVKVIEGSQIPSVPYSKTR